MIKTLLKVTLGTALVAGGISYYQYTRISKQEYKDLTFYFTEIQSEYDKMDSDFNALTQKKESFKPLYDAGKMGILGLHYDNPKWLVDPSKGRSALGFFVEKDVPEADKSKISLGMQSTDLPKFKVVAIPAYFCSISYMYNWWLGILMMKYFSKYGGSMKKHDIHNIPIGEFYTSKGGVIFMPTPKYAKKLMFITTAEPALNEKYHEDMKKYCAACGTVQAAKKEVEEKSKEAMKKVEEIKKGKEMEKAKEVVKKVEEKVKGSPVVKKAEEIVKGKDEKKK